MELDASGWSGEGAFTQLLIDALQTQQGIVAIKVEDAPASRAEAAYSFISNEVFVAFVPQRQARMSIPALSSVLESLPGIGAPDYADDGMIQYLRTERVIPPYQTRGYKLIEMVRIYEAGSGARSSPSPSSS
jgi:hypothetical protein